MDVAGDAQGLAAALNHSAFNVANAIGPWLGGLSIAAGFGADVHGLCRLRGWHWRGLGFGEYPDGNLDRWSRFDWRIFWCAIGQRGQKCDLSRAAPRERASCTSIGLQVVSPYGDVRVTPHVIDAAGLAHPFDLVLVGVKAYALGDAIRDFSAAVGPDTVIVPLLNGMRHLDELRLRFGDAVVGGLCRVHASLDAQGADRANDEAATIWNTGEFDGVRSERIPRCR